MGSKEIKKLYFDMDGVLSDFWGGLKEMCGEVDASDMDNVWDAVRNIDHFYFKLKPFAGSIDMIHQFMEKYGDKCEILAAIPTEKKNLKFAKEDKIAWVRKYIGPNIKVNIVLRSEKVSFCKGKGYILIDDFPKNIHEWEECGGTAILIKNIKQLDSLAEYL